jgi:hypothetical protein
MERPIVIARQDMVQVNVEPAIARNHPPPPKIWRVVRPDYEIWLAWDMPVPFD